MKKKATKLKLRIGKWRTKSCHFVIVDSLHIRLRKQIMRFAQVSIIYRTNPRYIASII